LRFSATIPASQYLLCQRASIRRCYSPGIESARCTPISATVWPLIRSGSSLAVRINKQAVLVFLNGGRKSPFPHLRRSGQSCTSGWHRKIVRLSIGL